MNSRLYVVFIWLAAVLLTPSRSLRAADVFFYTSSPKSYIGLGLTETIPINSIAAEHSLESDSGHTTTIDFQFQKSDGAFLSLDFIGPHSSVVTVGSYSNAARYGFQSPTQPGFDFSAYGYANGSLTATFQVLEITISNGILTNFAADFIQFDYGAADEWEMGSIRLNSNIPITVPEPSTITLLVLGALGLLVRRRFVSSVPAARGPSPPEG
jgi:hypothetical protein